MSRVWRDSQRYTKIDVVLLQDNLVSHSFAAGHVTKPEVVGVLFPTKTEMQQHLSCDTEYRKSVNWCRL